MRSYLHIDEVQTAVEEAAAAGALIAHPQESPGRGTFKIAIQGARCGLWQMCL